MSAVPRRHAGGKPALQLSGRAFGRLVVLGPAPKPPRQGHRSGRWWLCRCACGNERVHYGANLVSGGSTSCGCWRRERTAATGRRRQATRRDTAAAPQAAALAPSRCGSACL